MVSAYLDKKDNRLVIMAINCSTRMQVLGLKGLKIRGNAFDTYTTSKTRSLRKSTTPADKIRIAPRSIVTLAGRIE
jgi:hypothetical protein